MAFFPSEAMTEGLAFPVISAYYGTLTTAQLSPAIDLSKTGRVTFMVQGLTLGTAATVTAKFQGCATSAGSYVDIAGASATLVKATDDNKFVLLEISATSVKSLALGYKFVKLSVGADVSSAVIVSCVAAGSPNPISGQNAAGFKSASVF